MNAVRRLRDYLTWPSRCRYLGWRLGWRRHEPLTVRLRGGPRIVVRPEPATDLITAFEIFVSDLYDLPWRPEKIDCICDLGANVGYSVVHFCQKFPAARIHAFEPHPVHLEMIRRHLALNHLDAQVEVLGVAAGNAAGSAWLTDAESSSEVVAKPAASAHRIAVVDWLAWAESREIDLLKMDIEGSERVLLADPRFSRLRVGLLVLEWHFGPAGGDRQEAIAPLVAAGYEILKIEQDIPSCLLIWARRGGGG